MIVHYKIEHEQTHILIEFTHGDYYRVFNYVMCKKAIFNFCLKLGINEKITIVNTWCDA